MGSKLYLHIGTWKTGSSTIQQNLYNNKEKLYTEGFYYLCKENKLVVDDNVIGRFTSFQEWFVEQSIEKLRSILSRELKKKPDLTFISSAEEFSGDPFNGFKNVSIVAKHLKKIVEELDFDVKVIIYLRRQDDFLESLYTQSIHLGASHEFGEFAKQFNRDDFNWFDLVNSYAEYFGKENITVKKYHKAYLPNKNSLMRSFGESIGSKFLKSFQTTVSKNKGLNRDALEIFKITNQSFSEEEQYKLRNIFQEVNSKSAFEKYSYFSAEERKVFIDKYKFSNSNLQSEFFAEEPKSNLFPQPSYKNSEKSYGGLTNEAVLINTMRAMLVIQDRSLKRHRDFAQSFREKKLRNLIKKYLKKILKAMENIKIQFFNK